MPYTGVTGWRYWGNPNPKCPYCDNSIPGDELAIWAEGTFVVQCPHCDNEVYVQTHVRYSFNTALPENLPKEAK